jgi:diaminohydroxyphosphoribosylaminopyrimidine deaminase/5-amino-6-(5-phosphoribosylamino)uracil reductase
MTVRAEDKFMRRCLELSVKAEGMTYPNPLVGAVLVHDNVIIGEGYHQKRGEPHAEVIAINSVRERSLLCKSTLYVSLEPCSHFGRTPPCTDLIIKSGIPSVVVGTADTSRGPGNGVRKMTEAGTTVVVGNMEDECRWVNRRFFTFHEKKRPYIILKWAQSADGFIDKERPANSNTGPYWITGVSERVLVHKWRSVEQAILVGANTVRKDRPKLNVRYWTGQDPVKIILSGSGKLGDYPDVDPTGNNIVVFTHNKSAADAGQIQYILLKEDMPAAVQIVDYLYNSGIQSLFIEGGTQVFNHFISLDLWDEARIFTSRVNFTGGVKAPVIDGRFYERSDFATSTLKVLIKGSE